MTTLENNSPEKPNILGKIQKKLRTDVAKSQLIGKMSISLKRTVK